MGCSITRRIIRLCSLICLRGCCLALRYISMMKRRRQRNVWALGHYLGIKLSRWLISWRKYSISIMLPRRLKQTNRRRRQRLNQRLNQRLSQRYNQRLNRRPPQPVSNFMRQPDSRRECSRMNSRRSTIKCNNNGRWNDSNLNLRKSINSKRRLMSINSKNYLKNNRQVLKSWRFVLGYHWQASFSVGNSNRNRRSSSYSHTSKGSAVRISRMNTETSILCRPTLH